MVQPLAGYRVLDWTAFIQGSLASMMLGDLGAEVIKIEDRRTGDPARGTIGYSKLMKGGRPNFYFEHCNRNKKAITVDLTKQQGKEIIYQLVAKSDVFLHNYRKGAATKLGLDYATLSKYNQRLVYANASGWGNKGPDSNRASLDYMGMARSGFLALCGGAGAEPPHVTAGLADHAGGIMTAYAVTTALLMRERQGIGQEVETSMLGSMVFLLSMLVDFRLFTGVEQTEQPRNKPLNPLWNHYKCKDGKWLALGLLQADLHWPNLCRTLGLEQLEKDPRFENMVVRGQNGAEMAAILDKLLATKTRAEWLAILDKNNLICEPVNTVSDLVQDPQVLANDYITEFEHPAQGKMSLVGFPMHFSKASASVRLPAPEFGQHTEEVLQNILGYSWEDITKLKDEEVI